MSNFSTIRFYLLLTCLLTLARDCTWADDLKIAIASNFTPTIKKIESAFSVTHPNITFKISTASSGTLFSQIQAGAPFDIFFSADSFYPAELQKLNLVAGKPVSYATGRLVLWCANSNLPLSLNFLTSESVKTIAIADAKLAPYGLATKQVLQANQLLKNLNSKFVFGRSIGQVLQFTNSGSVDCAFLAFSQIQETDLPKGNLTIISESRYSPIIQQAIILKHAENKLTAKELLGFIVSNDGKQIIQQSGYGTF